MLCGWWRGTVTSEVIEEVRGGGRTKIERKKEKKQEEESMNESLMDLFVGWLLNVPATC